MRNNLGFTFQGSLAHRFAVLIVLGLLPLAALVFAQTRIMLEDVEDNRLAAVAGATMQVAAPEIELIRSTEGTARTLAAVVPTALGDPAACRALMDAAQRSKPEAVLVAYIPLSGRMECASGGRTHDFAGNPYFEALSSSPEPRMVINPKGPVSGTAVLGIAHPVSAGDGRQTGIVVISLPHHEIRPRGRDEGDATASDGDGGTASRQPVALITYDGDGTVLTAPGGVEAASGFLPASRALSELADGSARTFAAPDMQGTERIFAVVPLARGLYLMGVWPREDRPRAIPATVEAFLLPVLTCVAGFAVAAFAAQRLVTRHVQTLSHSMLRFAAGERLVAPVAMTNSPRELADLGAAYRSMVENILQDEAELENLLREKEALLREVHHRTGNSLQLIASILRMHLRQNPEPAMRAILDTLHDRVMNLSSVHMGLYAVSGRDEVDASALLRDVIGKVAAIRARAGRPWPVRAEIAPVRLLPQQAVLLAMLLSEVLSAVEAVDGDTAEEAASVTLTRPDDEGVRLVVASGRVGPTLLAADRHDAPAVIARRLIEGFVKQLGGTMSMANEDGRVSVDIRFRVIAVG